MKIKLIKDKCEIESCQSSILETLHFHHIIERTEVNTTNNIFNIAILCANCHAMTHSKRLKIIGVFPSTKPPNNRVLIYDLDGKKNIEGVDAPYIQFKSKSFKI